MMYLLAAIFRFRGSRHTDERSYIFGTYPTFYNITSNFETAEESRIKRDMMTAWANFAKTG